MKITYTKTSWVDGKTMVNSTNLNHIEDAISNVTTGALGTDQLRAGSGIVISDTVAGDKVIGVDPSITTEIQQLADSLSGCVKAVDGKGLSTNDLTDTLLSKLNSLENYNDTIVKSTIQDLQTQLDTLINGGGV